jgi:hypothetical protein
VSVTTGNPASAAAIQPFTIPEVSDAEFEALRAHHGDPVAREGDRH